MKSADCGRIRRRAPRAFTSRDEFFQRCVSGRLGMCWPQPSGKLSLRYGPTVVVRNILCRTAKTNLNSHRSFKSGEQLGRQDCVAVGPTQIAVFLIVVEAQR